MIGAIASVVLSALKLMTPNEIKRLTELANKTRASSSKKSQKHLSEEQVESESNLLEFVNATNEASKQSSDSQEVEPVETIQVKASGDFEPAVKSSYNSRKDSLLESAGIVSAHKLAQQRELAHLRERLSRPSTSMFLIEQRELIKNTKKSVEAQSGLALYHHQSRFEPELLEANQDLDVDSEQNASAERSKGVLINKKQY